MAAAARNLPTIGPHSRPGRLAIIDGRRAEAKLMQSVRSDLARHCGGSPSTVQRMLIDRAAALTLRLHLMDRAAGQDGAMSERNGREYLAWHNSLVRTLARLGLDPAKPTNSGPRAPSLAEILAEQEREHCA